MSKVETLFEGETLSEDFKTKVTVLVEAAVKEKEDALVLEHDEKIKTLEEAQVTKLDEALTKEKETLTEKVSEFLDAVVTEWAEENEVAIEKGVKVDIAESFLTGMKGLLTEHDVTAPEGQKDIVEALETKVEKVSESLDKALAGEIKAVSEMKTLKRNLTLLELSEELSDTEVEKLQSLTEDFDFDSEDKFKEKVKIVIESYFKNKSVIKEDVDELNEDHSTVSDSVKAYLDL